jgi:tetratricopeptide (TPR) repeat protein/SAM-dependent methyltransferase
VSHNLHKSPRQKVNRGKPAVPPGIQALLDRAYRDQKAGRLAEAERGYRELLTREPRHVGALHLLGMVGMQTGRSEMALELIGRAIQLDGGNAQFPMNLGNLFQVQGRLDEAVASYRRALELNPRSASAWSNLGEALKKQGRLDEAAASIGKALALQPELAVAHSNLGNVRQAQGQLDQALACYERALMLQPDLAMVYANMGNLREAQGLQRDAAACYERALELRPAFDVARLNWSILKLLEGDFAAGLPDYEKRRLLHPPRNFAQPQWRGEPLRGARILLHAEQGLGDSLQFLRYVPMVQAAGGEVILEVQASLRRLAAELPGMDAEHLFAAGDSLPEFAWQCPLMSLPLAFRTRVESIPASVPYLTFPAEAWRKAEALPWPAEGLRVGIAWAGSPAHLKDRFRSIAPTLLRPLLREERIRFFSLQVGPRAGELAELGEAVTDLAPRIEDMADTAALTMQLDLVIAVDTAVAHLAGALGKPVWVLLPLAPDWRWMLGREDSPWYPTMRLFRQERLGDWAGVIGRVCDALQEFRRESAGKGERRENGPPVLVASSEAGEAGEIAAGVIGDPRFQVSEARPVAPRRVPCKVCGEGCGLFGLVDFHKSCEEARGKKLALSGFAVYYRRCARCGFVFTCDFDGWAPEDFQRYIYNADYRLVDPDYTEVRPAGNARLVAESFAVSREAMRILDYGGGAGVLAKRLQEAGFRAETYDPFSGFDAPPTGPFDLVTCFEVMEHVPSPRETVRAMAGLLKEEGAILFSTLVQPKDFARVGLGWWYAAPRNGHISLYSTAALARLFGEAGMKVVSFSEAMHLAYRKVPGFAGHLGLPG